MTADAVEDMEKSKPGDPWVRYRCPHCNCWDAALQGVPGTVKPDTYTCEECGLGFRVPG